MSDKSFEQQVREELSDLRIKPNAAVWDSVAASLKKEKKRRWALWMFFLLAGLSIASIWWMTQFNQKEEVISQQKQFTEPKHNKKTISAPSATLQPTIEKSGIVTGNIQPAKDLTSNGRVNHTVSNNTSKSFTDVPAGNLETTLKKDGLVTQIPVTEKLAEKKQTDTSVNKIATEKELREETFTNAATTGTTDLSANTSTQYINKADSTKAQQENEPQKLTEPTDSVVPKKETKKNKWQWRAGTNLGFSGIRNSLRSLFEKTNENAYSNAFMGNGSPIITPPGSAGSSGSNNSTPVVRDAFSFGAFVELTRPFGKRSQHAISFISGYQLYTTKTGIGAINNGTVQFNNVNRTNEANRYFSIKDSASYTSNYHFLQLGIRYAHTLNWFKKVDMHWYGGIGANILIASNGLHLGNNGSGTYLFQNKSLIRPVQLDISGGIDIGLGKKKTIYVGPQVQYFLSNLSKQPGVNQHLFRPSIRMTLNISRINQ